jgi:hypothetical protein
MTTAELVNSTTENRETPPPHAEDSQRAPLFDERETNDLRTRWQDVQGRFVDDPQASVEQADQLVASSMKRLAEIFAKERADLEAAWSKGGEVSTEDLRQALRRYRSFFDRLLSI